MTIKDIQDKIKDGKYRFSDHSVRRMIEKFVDRHEVEEVVLGGEIIEEYPDDKYSPSCLIYGNTSKGRNLHVQISYPPAVVVITTYEPGPEEWVNGKVRR